MREKTDTILKKTANFLNFSPDLLYGGMTVTLYAGNQVVIAGYKKIIEYDDSILRLSDEKDEVTILGVNLILMEMSDEGLVVEGDIRSVELNKNISKKK